MRENCTSGSTGGRWKRADDGRTTALVPLGTGRSIHRGLLHRATSRPYGLHGPGDQATIAILQLVEDRAPVLLLGLGAGGEPEALAQWAVGAQPRQGRR